MSQILRKTLPLLTKKYCNIQQIRFVPRWEMRKPKRVFSPEEYEKIEENLLNKKINNAEKSSISWHFSKPKQENEVKLKIKRKDVPLTTKQKKGTFDMLNVVIDQDGNFVYTKMGDKDPKITLILTEIKSQKEQEKKDLILLEGKRLIKDALLAGCQLKYIIFSRRNEVEFIKPYLPKMGAELFKISYREIQMWSDLSTSPGIMGVFKTPSTTNYQSKDSLPLTVICENIREPGNLGTILRICAGVGCQDVILLKGCVNLWDPKVLRGASGAHFRLRIKSNETLEKVKDSLPQNSHFFVADNKTITESDDNLDKVVSKIPFIPYFGADFAVSGHIVLLIGGETFGVSETAYNFVNDTNGVVLNVPLSNGVESLNVGAALGVIAFEIKRQLLVKK